MDRPKPFSHVHLRRVADPDSGGGSGRGPRRVDSGPKPCAFGRGFGFEFGLEEREPTTPNHAPMRLSPFGRAPRECHGERLSMVKIFFLVASTLSVGTGSGHR